VKLLFNLEVIEGKRIRARPSDWLNSLAPQEQLAAVTEFLAWAEHEAAGNSDPQARAEAEIGIATARQFLDGLERERPKIITDARGSDADD
jgi:hypothetical protein